MSQEFPQKPSEPRDPSAESREAFLDCLTLQHLNSTLGMMFEYIDDHKIKEQLEAGEVAELKRSIQHQLQNPQPGIAPPRPDALREFRQQTLSSLYSPNTLANILTQRAESANRPLTSQEEFIFADYTQFYDIFTNHPELRVRLLEKMMATIVAYGRFSLGLKERNTFGRFLYEFYGTEKKNEKTAEYFLSLDAQTDLLEAWNTVDHWGFTKEQFADIRRQFPSVREQASRYADQPFVASIVTPRLGDIVRSTGKRSAPTTGVGRTFSALIAVAWSLRDGISGFLQESPMPYRVELAAGTSYQPGLDIGLVDLNGQGGRLSSRPQELGVPEYRRSDFRGLAAFAMNPRWADAVRDYGEEDIMLDNFNIYSAEDEQGFGDFTLAVGFSYGSPIPHYRALTRQRVSWYDFAEDLD